MSHLADTRRNRAGGRARRLAVAIAAGLGLVVVAVPWAFAQDDVVSAVSTVSLSHDPGFEGYWKYCVAINWDVTAVWTTPHAVSHATVIFGLDDCPDACDYGYFLFSDTVGVSSGEGGCTVDYYAEFSCKGDPSIGVVIPTLKFEPYTAVCEPGVVGLGRFCFYSIAPPRTVEEYPSTVWIKYGLSAASGPLTGSLPGCKTYDAVKPSSWGAIKALLR